ncbi:MAG: hypothetical protein WD534_12950 [Phycisphaeraceae bacterium]
MSLILPSVSNPSDPPEGHRRLYVDADGRFVLRRPDGSEAVLGLPAGSEPVIFRRRLEAAQVSGSLALAEEPDPVLGDRDTHEAFHWPSLTYTIPADGLYHVGFHLEIDSGNPNTYKLYGWPTVAGTSGSNFFVHSFGADPPVYVSESDLISFSAGQVLRWAATASHGLVVADPSHPGSYVTIIRMMEV